MSEEVEENLLINEVKLLLAEKRTYLAILRTGAALFGLSVSALSVVLLTIEPGEIFSVGWSPVVMLILAGIAIVGAVQMIYSRKKVIRLNGLITKIEEKNKRIAEIIID